MDRAEEVADEIVLGAAGRRRAADEIEKLAVLHAVFGKPLNFPVLVEVNRHHTLVGDADIHKRDRTIGALRDVVERFAADSRYRRGCAENQQHLLLRGAKRNLLERALGQNIATLKGLAEAAAQAAAQATTVRPEQPLDVSQKLCRRIPRTPTSPILRRNAACRTPKARNWQSAAQRAL